MLQNVFRTGTCNAKECDTPSTALMCTVHLSMVPPALRQLIAGSSDPSDCDPAILTAAIDAVAHKQN